MNILIPHSWLLDFLETKATAKQIAQVLSLHSASVESVSKVADDWIYNIEITTNRIDIASVYGIAREASAALPRLGFKAKLKSWNMEHGTWNMTNVNKEYLKVKITNPTLCPRFTTLLYRIEVKPSPKWIQERLKRSGMRPVNNIVDITNYVMLELGQPMHAFDYNKLKTQNSQPHRRVAAEATKLKTASQMSKLIVLRESKTGEKIKTLDGAERILSGGDIVIEDGGERLIDLCGIMGGENTAIDRNTRTVLLFAQTYNPDRIRKTIQTTGLRTEAATRFEKGLDPESVMPALSRAHQLLQQTAEAKLIGGLIGVYPKPYRAKKITLDLNLIEKYLAIKVSKKEISSILSPLGFKVNNNEAMKQWNNLSVFIPSWRASDINIQEDLIEEIARIYGYHNLPSNLNIGQPIKPAGSQFYWLNKAKNALKYWGFAEVYTSSLVSKDLLTQTGFDPKKCLKLKNPLGKESEYLRPSLIPGILQVVKENKSKVGERVKIFELSKVYLRNNPEQVKSKRVTPLSSPVQEPLMLTAAMTASNFLKAKGVVEVLLEELGIKDYQISPQVAQSCPIVKLLHPYRRASIAIQQMRQCGLIGQIEDIVIFDLNFETLLKHASSSKTYQPLPQYPPIIEDLSFIFPPKTYLGPVIEEIKRISSLVSQVELIDSYENTRTLRISYQHPKRNLTAGEVKTVREKIIRIIETKFQAKAKI